MGNQDKSSNTIHPKNTSHRSIPGVFRQLLISRFTFAMSYPPLIDDCIPAQKLLWMRVTSVWDDTLHHGSFNNLAVVELAVSKHNRAAILE